MGPGAFFGTAECRRVCLSRTHALLPLGTRFNASS